MLEFDEDLINKYHVPCPRYTSYPTALQFSDQFTEAKYINIAKNSNIDQKPISLYLHLPFCNTLCYFCACNKIITKKTDKTDKYLELLEKEIILQSKLFNNNRLVTQLHFGGGTPTFFTDEQLTKIMQLLAKHFNLNFVHGEYSIEVDPRSVTPDRISILKNIGLNRISLGVQDFDPIVQKAVNRIQPLELTESIIKSARLNKFNSINIDLIYGLPHQTLTTFSDTIDKIITMDPDRISLFNYAHLPNRVVAQKMIKEQDLPLPSEKLKILKLSIEKLTKAGYVFIGMDHFAKQNDELTLAQRNNNLYRNFQGYSTNAECDLVGLGVSAISSIGNSYSQNAYTIEEYETLLDNNKIPIIKGVEIDLDDQIRKTIIMELICYFKLNFNKVENLYNINFAEYFAKELTSLESLVKDELITLTTESIIVTKKGRLLIRNICAQFDRYFMVQNSDVNKRHSKAI